MKKSELKQIIKEEILKERQVFKTGEFEYIASAAQDLEDYSSVFPPAIEKKLKKYSKEILKFVDDYGFEER